MFYSAWQSSSLAWHNNSEQSLEVSETWSGSNVHPDSSCFFHISKKMHVWFFEVSQHQSPYQVCHLTKSFPARQLNSLLTILSVHLVFSHPHTFLILHMTRILSTRLQDQSYHPHMANSKWGLAFCWLIATLRAPCSTAVAVSLVCLWWTSGDQTCHQRQGVQMTTFDLTDVFTTYLYLRGCSGNKQISLCTRL